MIRSLLVRASLALALVLGAHGLSVLSSGHLFAAPMAAAQSTGATTWAVVGDYGSGDANAAAVGNLVKGWSPIYIVTNGDGYRVEAGGSGDTKYDYSTGAFYCQFMAGISTTGTKCPPPGPSGNNRFYAALGNHDYTDAGTSNNLPTTYTNYFSLPGPGAVSNGNSGNERYYDVVQGPIHFYIINSNNGAGQEPDGTSSTSVQATWLKNRLAASSLAWKIVVFHHPPYSSGSQGSNAWMQWPFAQWGANVVISGHDHDYERILRDGIVYFVNGTGGATESTYNCGTLVTGSQVCLDKVFGAQRVTASSTSLTFDFITTAGVLRDTYTLTKSTATSTPATTPSKTPTAAPSASPVTGCSLPGQRCWSAFLPIIHSATPVTGCSLLGQPGSGPYCWGIIGSDSNKNGSEYGIGVRYKLFSLHWREFAPSEGNIDASYVSRKQTELAQLRQAGLRPILSLGVHDAPGWIHTNYANSYYVDQYGDVYTDGLDCGDANLLFNPTLRARAATYIQNVFATFGTDFAAVRLGAGRYGELTYPPASFGGKSNLYWNYDANALARSPTGAWHPGDASPSGQAKTFLRWHLDALTEFQNWQITLLRQKNYQGPLMILYPSWGIRPGDFDKAVATNLNGSSSAESNGEIQRGFDYQSQIAAITDPKVIVTGTWMDASASNDAGTDQRYWSPIHYLAYLAHSHPLNLSVFGENTGQGKRSAMDLSALQMKRYNLIGMMWYNETQLFSGTYATLTDYQQVIAANAN